MRRPLIDVIEELGAAVAAGTLDSDLACDQLQQRSDGGLTARGAREMIDNWQSARAEYKRGREIARSGLVRSLNQVYDNS